MRQVCLAAELSNPRHAVQLSSGQFVVSLKDSICLVGADGRRMLANSPSTLAGIPLRGAVSAGRRPFVCPLVCLSV